MRHTPISEVVDYLLALGKNPSHCQERLLDLAKQSKNASDFLDRLFLQRENEPFAYGVEKVSLLTLHAAKGLEFPVVFIAGCEEGVLPLVRHGEEPNTEEERRLFYVGMTRAKRALYLTWAQKRMLYGKTQESSTSSFVLDIEEKLKEYETASLKERKKQHDQQLNLFKNF
jgi:superfamily I DNA/RNA helicase